MNASDYAAWYGAVVASGSLALSLTTVWADTAHLYVRLTPGMKLTESYGTYSTDHTYCLVTVSNRGRRPVSVTKVAFSQKHEAQTLLLIDALRAGTVDLTEGKSRDYMMRDDNYDLSGLKEVMVVDGVGRTWKAAVQMKTPTKLKRQRD